MARITCENCGESLDHCYCECIAEFGPHTDHNDCERMLDVMRNGYPEPAPDYSEWYGGERGYNDGLRWSDFI